MQETLTNNISVLLVGGKMKFSFTGIYSSSIHKFLVMFISFKDGKRARKKCSLSWRIASYHYWEQSNTDRHDRGLRSTENKLTKPSDWTRLEVKMENLRALWGRSECSPEHLFFFGNQVTLSIKHSNKVPEGEEIRWRLVCVWVVKWFYESLCVCADLCSGLK